MKLCPSVFRCSLHDVRDGLGKVGGGGKERSVVVSKG